MSHNAVPNFGVLTGCKSTPLYLRTLVFFHVPLGDIVVILIKTSFITPPLPIDDSNVTKCQVWSPRRKTCKLKEATDNMYLRITRVMRKFVLYYIPFRIQSTYYIYVFVNKQVT